MTSLVLCLLLAARGSSGNPFAQEGRSAAEKTEKTVPPPATAPLESTEPPPQEPKPADVETFNPKELEGQDTKVAELAAHRLLQAIARKDTSPQGEALRKERLDYLLEKLSPSRLGQPGADWVTAGRIVDAVATWITSSGPPFPKVSEVLLPLVGVGPGTFRETMIRAMRALVVNEMSQGRVSPTLGVLTARFSQDPPPQEALVRDAAKILWEADGKTLLGVLVGILAEHGGDAPGTPGFSMASVVLEELRARIPIDFPSLERWQGWWNDNRELPLEKILAGCQARSREEHLNNWKQLMRRLRETGDAERLLLAINDTLEAVSGVEVRTAAVAALGDYAEWVLEIRIGEGSSPEKLLENDGKDKLLRRGVLILQSILDRKSVYVERPEVEKAALMALRKFHVFLERNPELLNDISRIVGLRLSDWFLQDRKKREDLLETIRLAGALRVSGAHRFVESIVKEAEAAAEARGAPTGTDPPPQNPPASDPSTTRPAVLGDDTEILTAAVAALGRLVEKKGIDQATADLLIRCFKRSRSTADKATRELRRACVTALGADAQDASVRSHLVSFYRDVLSSTADKDLHIPAILGLGTLARQKDTDALGTLVDVLARQDRFEPQQVIAAIDSIAYVGGQTALSTFLRQLVSVKEKSVEEHLWKKVVGLVADGGSASLSATLDALEQTALEEDTSSYLEFSVSLCLEPQIKELLAAGKQGLGGDGSSWKAMLSFARALDLLGKEEEVSAKLAELTDLVQKNPALKEDLQQRVGELTEMKSALQQRAKIKERISKIGATDVASILKDIEALCFMTSTRAGRWINLLWVYRQLSQSPPSERLDRLRDSWYASLQAEHNAAFWNGFSPGFKEKQLSRLDALKQKTSPAPSGGSTASPK